MSILFPPHLVVLPTPTTFAERVYAQLDPLKYAESGLGNPLSVYTDSLNPMFDEIDEYASDGDFGEVGWSSIMDVDRAPLKALPWLAQFVGVTLDQTLSEADQRNQVKTVPGFSRGTKASIIAAAQRHLTGTRDVIMIERYQGKAYRLYIATRTAQTPNNLVTIADIKTQKPAGITLFYEILSGQTFQELLGDSPLMSNIFGNYATFQGALTGVHGT